MSGGPSTVRIKAPARVRGRYMLRRLVVQGTAACLGADDVKAAARPPHSKGVEALLVRVEISRDKELDILGECRRGEAYF
jgi:hypothetical protein